MRFERAARRAAALMVGVLLGSGVAACGSDGAGGALDDFLTAWKAHDLAKIGFVDTAGKPIGSAAVTTELTKVAGELPTSTLQLTQAGKVKETGDNAVGALKLGWTLAGNVPWSYESVVRLTKRGDGGWKVIWEPAVLHGNLGAGDQLRLQRQPADRAGILGLGGEEIVVARPVVTVTVPAGFTEVAKLTAALKSVGVDVDPADLEATGPVEVVTLRRSDFSKIEAKLRKLRGITFTDGRRELAPTRMFARALLGTVDPATADDIAANPGTIGRGDDAGHGGLQQRYDNRLRGTPALHVVIERAGAKQPTPIFSTEPVAGTPVRTTIDVRTQNAADLATAGSKRLSSLVAVRVSDSSVLAVSNGPDGGATTWR